MNWMGVGLTMENKEDNSTLNPTEGVAPHSRAWRFGLLLLCVVERFQKRRDFRREEISEEKRFQKRRSVRVVVSRSITTSKPTSQNNTSDKKAIIRTLPINAIKCAHSYIS
jgi:hypothetical protein